MMGYQAVLKSRESVDGLGWVVDATWTGRPAKQLLGLFTSAEAADDWIKKGSQRWRLQQSDHQGGVVVD